MNSSVYCFPMDLADEGHDQVLQNVRERAGVDGISLAVAYHDARDLFPHNPKRKIVYGRGGGVFFRPRYERYTGLALRPSIHAEAGRIDPLATACDAAARHGSAVAAWTVYTHDDRLGFTAPGCVVQNVYGDPYLTNLCPAHPDVRAYAQALTADVVRYPVDSIVAEALHFLPFEHGAHHERCFVALGDVARLLLAVCFCVHCRRAAEEHGVDSEATALAVRDYLDRALAGELATDRLALDDARNWQLGDLAGYLAARTSTVTSLAEEVAAVAGKADVTIRFLDPSLAIAGSSSGATETPPAVSVSWQLGIDPVAISRSCALEVPAYVRDPARLHRELAAYREALGPGDAPAVVLRPMIPDCSSEMALVQNVRAARDAGSQAIHFYNYGFAPIAALDWIHAALGAADGDP